MAIKLLKVGNSFNTPRKYYVSDSLNELENIANFGDLALVPESSSGIAKVYVRGSGYWTEYSEGSGGGGGTSTEETAERIMADMDIKIPHGAAKDSHIYQANFSNINYDDYVKANEILEKTYNPSIGACTSFRKGNWIGRNYDWYYNDNAEFIVRTSAINGRNATIGIAQHPLITDEMARTRQYTDSYFMLPFFTLDGVNDKGVYCNINVTAVGDRGVTKGTNPGAQRMCATMIVRYVLDYAQTASHAVNLLHTVDLWSMASEEFHFMISDKDETYIVEFVNNRIVFTNCTDGKANPAAIMTNFCLANQDASSWYDGTHNIMGAHQEGDFFLETEHPQGVERFDYLAKVFDSINSKEEAVKTMEALKYSQTYTTDNWPTEILGRYSSGDLNWGCTVDSELFQNIRGKSIALYKEGQGQGIRDGNTWFTAHTSVYDVTGKILYLYTQENYTNEVVISLEENAGTGSVTREEVLAMIDAYLQDEEKMRPFEERITKRVIIEVGKDALSKSRTVVEMQPGLAVGTLVFGTILE